LLKDLKNAQIPRGQENIRMITGQVVADIGEMFCCGRVEESPFIGHHLVMGYGGNEGFSIYQTSTFNDKVGGNGVDATSDYPTDACDVMIDYITTSVQDYKLMQPGLERTKK
jgi:hypothetical protein